MDSKVDNHVMRIYLYVHFLLASVNGILHNNEYFRLRSAMAVE